MQKIDYARVGMRIRQARKNKGWSQEELAGQCGICMSFLGHIERGTRIMSLDTFAGICRALGVHADELLWGRTQLSDRRLADMWGESGRTDGGRYEMYVRIMNSVAEIMDDA